MPEPTTKPNPQAPVLRVVFTPEATRQIIDFRQRLGYKSEMEFISKSLALFQVLAQMADEDGKVHIMNKQGKFEPVTIRAN